MPRTAHDGREARPDGGLSRVGSSPPPAAHSTRSAFIPPTPRLAGPRSMPPSPTAQRRDTLENYRARPTLCSCDKARNGPPLDRQSRLGYGGDAASCAPVRASERGARSEVLQSSSRTAMVAFGELLRLIRHPDRPGVPYCPRPGSASWRPTAHLFLLTGRRFALGALTPTLGGGDGRASRPSPGRSARQVGANGARRQDPSTAGCSRRRL
jgi:hypothetical protein